MSHSRPRGHGGSPPAAYEADCPTRASPRRPDAGLKSASKGEAPRWRRRSYPGPGLTPSPRRGCENLNAAPLRSNAAEVALLRANISRRRDMLYGSRRDMLELGRLITYPVETRRAVGMTTMGEMCAGESKFRAALGKGSARGDDGDGGDGSAARESDRDGVIKRRGGGRRAPGGRRRGARRRRRRRRR